MQVVADALPPLPECSTKHRNGAPLAGVDLVAVVDRLRALVAGADPADVVDGAKWYPTAGAVLADAAKAAGLPLHLGAAVAAVLSPRSPWHSANLPSALALLANPDASTVGAVLPDRVQLARDLLRGAVDLATALRSPKVAAFARNLAGDYQPATIDVWALRGALGAEVDPGRCGCGHRRLGQAFALLGAELGLSTAATQAVAWVAVQRVWSTPVAE